MLSSERIRAEIEHKFGFFPPFFEPALQTPLVLEQLWEQTLSAYINNPLSPLFREKLSAYLSRFCKVPYCLITHSCSLRELGMNARDILLLLEAQPPKDSCVDRHLEIIATQPEKNRFSPKLNKTIEASLIECAIYIFLEGKASEYCASELQRLLGTNNYHYLIILIVYIRVCHTWMEAHPETAYHYIEDQRAKNCLSDLIEEAPALADFFLNYQEKVNRERRKWTEYRAALRERQRNREILQQSETNLKLALEAAGMKTWEWTIPTTWCESYTNFIINVHPEDRGLVNQAVARSVAERVEFSIEFRLLEPDKTVSWKLSKGQVFYNSAGRAIRMTGVEMDVTKNKCMEEKLRHDAEYDRLTELPNRTLFMKRLRSSLDLARHYTYLFAVLFIDLDRFKVVNDSLGHHVGDQLLVAIARRLEQCVRNSDTVARLGGDEFVILLDRIKDVHDATQVAQRIQQHLTAPFNLNHHELFASASIGIALSSGGYEQAEDLLRDADTVMYRAKAKGKARHEIFNVGMHTQSVALLQLETSLRHAIERQEWLLHYQPIIEVDTGLIRGFEALIRWQHPQQGLVHPLEFIPLAEETGLIVPIGEWVLREACRQMQIWQTQFPELAPLSVSVNLSTKQFSQPGLSQLIEQILYETQLDAQSLKLEITESVIMENSELAMVQLKHLQDMGIEFYLDDFGTGYSSLSYLHRFPSQALKIDRSFVSQMTVECDCASRTARGDRFEVIHSIIMLAESLGMKVIAEGVETKEQLAALKALRCKYVQGFLFSSAVESASVEILLEKNRQKVGMKNLTFLR